MVTRAAVPATQVAAVRAFNRFYTQRIGVLKPYLDSDFTLTEVRVLYELAHRRQPTATELRHELALDAGYLSRILHRFESRGWIERQASREDARRSLLRLTPPGRAAFEPLQQKSHEETAALLATVPQPARERVIAAMAMLQRLLEPQPAEAAEVLLRPPRPGDLGWVVQVHGEIYAREYGFNSRFEALVADIAAKFLRSFDPARENGWIAEWHGERAGSAFVVRRSARVAQLRLLVVTPEARGLGLGARLVDECIAFARAAGYRKLVLWTHGQLRAARAIYRSRGFARVGREPLDADYAAGLTSETWELTL